MKTIFVKCLLKIALPVVDFNPDETLGVFQPKTKSFPLKGFFQFFVNFPEYVHNQQPQVQWQILTEKGP